MSIQSPKDKSAPQSDALRPKHLPLLAARAAPASVPARMLNEVSYCERLMYLEWVQGEFKDNYFTVDGRSVHERADVPGGKLPALSTPVTEEDDGAEDGAETAPYQARSVWVTSDKLGITAKIDIVDGDTTGHVVPIECTSEGALPISSKARTFRNACSCARMSCCCVNRATLAIGPRSISQGATSAFASRSRTPWSIRHCGLLALRVRLLRGANHRRR